MDNTGIHDIFVIGNRIDGYGMARDAAIRGRVVLAQRRDLDVPAAGAPQARAALNQVYPQTSMEQKNA